MVRMVHGSFNIGRFEERNAGYLEALRNAGHDPEVDFTAGAEGAIHGRPFVYCRNCKEWARRWIPWSWQRLSPFRPCTGAF